jgi:hypothetical protein
MWKSFGTTHCEICAASSDGGDSPVMVTLAEAEELAVVEIFSPAPVVGDDILVGDAVTPEGSVEVGDGVFGRVASGSAGAVVADADAEAEAVAVVDSSTRSLSRCDASFSRAI